MLPHLAQLRGQAAVAYAYVSAGFEGILQLLVLMTDAALSPALIPCPVFATSASCFCATPGS